MLRVPRKLTDAIIDHAYEGFPLKVCGILGGKDGIVSTLYRMTNTDRSREHFSMDPNEQFAVMKKIRDEGQEVLAIYHSHPESPARPSTGELHLAFTHDVSYVIVSLMKLDNPVLKSFRITADHFEPEEVEYL